MEERQRHPDPLLRGKGDGSIAIGEILIVATAELVISG
jgi:hypothetical protein